MVEKCQIASAAISLLFLALFGAREWGEISGAPDVTALLLFAVSFGILRWKKISPMRIIVGTGLAGIILYTAF